MATFGTIGSFDTNAESWTQYTERLEQFFVANEIDDGDRRRAIFLTVIGPSTYGLLKNLLSPDAPTSRNLQQLITVLSRHFDPLPSEIVERFKFNSRMRRTGESVADFVAELRRLAKNCNYGASLDMMLRDRIVCGIGDEGIQRKLLSETGLTLQRATEIAVSMETAAQNAVDLRQTSSLSEVHRIHQNKSAYHSANEQRKSPVSKTKVDKNNSISRCFRCGDFSHRSADCKFINSICNFCQKMGHIARICQSKQKNSRKTVTVGNRTLRKVNQLQEVPAPTIASEIPHQYTLFNLNGSGEAPPPARVTCNIEGKPFVFEVDSGAPFTLIPYDTFNKFKDNFPPLEATTVKLQSFTKHSIDIMGTIQVSVTFQSKSKELPLLVVKQGNVNLAGRNWIYPLGLMSVFESNSKITTPATNSIMMDKGPNVVSETSKLDTLLAKHKDLFSPGLGIIKGTKVHLTVRPEVPPKFFKARPVPYALKDKVEQELDRLVKNGVIEPVKMSQWAAPVVPVLKKDGSIRLCGDFKVTVNTATELEQYPLPKIEDLFAQLSGVAFSKLDLQDAYCQLELDEESRQLVVINTHKGLFRYNRMPFGVASAPAIFQREMEKILQNQQGASCYLDDLLVTGGTEQQHLLHLDEVLTKLEEVGAKLNPGKCQFLQSSVEYLGHRVDKDGLHPVESKLEAIEKAPAPKNIDELRSFIGLLTYYSKFLPNMATVLVPLYKLLESKQHWKWSKQQNEAFSRAKETLKNSSLLVHFDNDKEVILACDASPYGLGAVLSHKTAEGDRPIAFASRSLTKAEKNYSQIEKETLALVFGVTRFRNYLLGRTFILLTDHRPLVSLLSENKPVPPVAAARIQRWALTLSAYAYKIQFRRGTLHSNADACSRLPLQTHFADPPVPAENVLLIEQLNDTPVTAHLIETEINKTPSLSMVKSYIAKGWPKTVPPNLHPFWLARNELTVGNGLILRGTRVFIPEKFRTFVMDELHVGHQGMSAIKTMARSSVWWPGIDHDLESKVRVCHSCQENSAAPPIKQVSWPATKEPWDRIHIDHAGPVDKHMLLVVVDAGSKWLEVIPVASTSSSTTIIALRGIFARFGLPKSLVSDNGTSFTSDEFSSFLVKNGITHIRTAPYHPNSNGLAERAVRTVKSALKKISDGTFSDRLDTFLFTYRRTPLAATGISPAMVMLGRPVRGRLDLLLRKKGDPNCERGISYSESYSVGDPVWTRKFGRGSRWISGTVLRSVGNVMLEITTPYGIWTRHLDQIRRAERECLPAVHNPRPASETHASEILPLPTPSLAKPNSMDTSGGDTLPVLSPVSTKQTVTTNLDPPVLSPQVNAEAVTQDISVRPVLRRSTRFRLPPRRLVL